jgi:hypothetical protein
MDRAELLATLQQALRLAQQQQLAASAAGRLDLYTQAWERCRTYRGLLEDVRDSRVRPEDVAPLLHALTEKGGES